MLRVIRIGKKVKRNRNEFDGELKERAKKKRTGKVKAKKKKEKKRKQNG